ncbi:MAG: hypothetical protein ACR2LN_02325 [Candidatus Levyibacteriota bacterium]
MATKDTEQEEPTNNKDLLPSTTGLIRESLATYKKHFRTWLPIYLIFGINAGLSEIVRDLVQTHLLPDLVGFLLAVIFDAVGIYATVLLILALKNKANHIELMDNHAISKAWPFFLVSLCYGLMVVFGYLLLIIPGIIVTAWYAFAGVILLTENLGFKASFAKSKLYVKNHFWRIYRLIASFIVTLVLAYIVIYLIVGFIGTSLFHVTGNLPSFYNSMISIIITILIESVISALVIIYNFQLYMHVKALPPVKSPSEKAAK